MGGWTDRDGWAEVNDRHEWAWSMGDGSMQHRHLFITNVFFFFHLPDQILHTGNQIHSIRHHGHDGVLDAVPS